jgi:cytochrome c-type biogenesis protein CcmH
VPRGLANLALLAALAALTPLASPVHAEEGAEVGREAHALSRDLMSPYCPGRTLADCPSPDAGQVREEIRTRMRSGESAEAIRADLESRFGAAVRGVPQSVLGWAIPGLLLAAGGLLLVVALRRLSARPAPGPVQEADPELEQRLDAELRKRGL